MNKAKKFLILALCAVLLVAGSVMGTLAWLTSNATVTNTFTVGKVAITMDELNVDGKDANGNDNSSEERDAANKYKLVPGKILQKDPTITVSSDSEDCYLFVKIVNGLADVEDSTSANKIADQLTANGWKALSGVANVYYYAGGQNTAIVNSKGAVPAGAVTVVFSTFPISKTASETELNNYKDATIEIVAYAVQAEGFDTAAAAWAAANFLG